MDCRFICSAPERTQKQFALIEVLLVIMVHLKFLQLIQKIATIARTHAFTKPRYLPTVTPTRNEKSKKESLLYLH